MHQNNWFMAGFGMVVAAAGGACEVQHHIVMGAAAVVVGLAGWVVFSGSSFFLTPDHDPNSHVANDSHSGEQWTHVVRDSGDVEVPPAL